MGGYGISDSGQRLPFGRVQANSLADEVAAQLYRAITSGQLRPGEKVVEATLCRQMDVSRAPIREATRMLVERGLLVQVPRRGVFVREYSVKEIKEINELRLAIEVGAISRAMSGGYLLQLDRLEGALREPAEDLDDHLASSLLERELNIHREIVMLYPNARFQRAFDDVANELRVSMAGVSLPEISGAGYDGEYAPVVRAIRAHDEARVIDLLTEIVHGCAARILAALNPSEQEQVEQLKPVPKPMAG